MGRSRSINDVFIFMVTFATCFSISCGEEATSNATSKISRGLEIPDSSLLLLDRKNIRKLASLKYYGRQSSGNDTSTEEEEDSRRCTCSLGVCKCCTGAVLDLINQKACMRITYHPGDFAFDVAMSLNDRVLYENSLSGKNPRPICISPPRINNLKFCARFYNVFFPGRNFHFCLAMNGKWRSNELYNFSFDCLRSLKNVKISKCVTLKTEEICSVLLDPECTLSPNVIFCMGANGITRVKPEENGGLPIPNPQGGVDAVVDSGDDIEEYDENVVKSLLNIFDDDDDD